MTNVDLLHRFIIERTRLSHILPTTHKRGFPGYPTRLSNTSSNGTRTNPSTPRSLSTTFVNFQLPSKTSKFVKLRRRLQLSRMRSRRNRGRRQSVRKRPKVQPSRFWALLRPIGICDIGILVFGFDWWSVIPVGWIRIYMMKHLMILATTRMTSCKLSSTTQSIFLWSLFIRHPPCIKSTGIMRVHMSLP